MNKDEQNIADLQFILSELKRFASMSIQQIRDHLSKNPGDGLYHLSHPTRGVLLCGRSAYERFGELADRMTTPTSLEKRVFDRSGYIHALRTAFVELFVDGDLRINQSSGAKLKNCAREKASKELVELTHYVPCAVFYERNPSEFKVGPVTFTRSDKFFVDTENVLSVYEKACIESYIKGEQRSSTGLNPEDILSKATDFAARHVSNLREYYSDYDWVASVRIPSCHKSISVNRAERTVDAALDVLRLFVPTRPDRYRRANAPNAPYHTHSLAVDAAGEIGVTVARQGQGAPAGDGWYENLFSHEATRLIWNLFEEAIDMLTTGDKSDELNQRLLDGLNWFGQAVIELNPGAKIVKYTAALERLVMTGHVQSGIEALIMRRVALLNQSRRDRTGEQIRKELGQLYQCRSDLMHGSISPNDSSVLKTLLIGREAVRWSLFDAVQLFAVLRQDGRANRKALEFAYEGPKFPEEWLKVAAYYIWEREGRPHGIDMEHWSLAEAELTRLWKARKLKFP